jgi:hypothetical protein
MWYTPPADPAWRLCPFHWLTGLDCPFCGLTRALFALGKGHLRDAAHFNALAPLAAAMLIATVLRRPWAGRLCSNGLAAFALYGVVRNWPS